MENDMNKTEKRIYVVYRTEFGDKKILTVTESRDFARRLAESFGYIVEIRDSLQLDPFDPVGGDADGNTD